uniref:Inositol polyphosphate 1-phosphatase n=1 Tax=Strix occidentalis caurina TaxID=311401 RepID=A0A8D0ER98_STROC
GTGWGGPRGAPVSPCAALSCPVPPQFPELQGHIHGEESNEFRNAQGESRGGGGGGGVLAGETVTVRVCATPGDTAALLLSVLEPERAAAELLAAAVHRDVALGDTELAGAALSIPPQDLAIWIDPIGEGVRGEGGVGTPPGHTRRRPSRGDFGCARRLHQRVHRRARGRGPRRWHRPGGAELGAGAHRGLRPAHGLPRAGRHQRALLPPRPPDPQVPAPRRHRDGEHGLILAPGDGEKEGGCPCSASPCPRRWQGRYHWGVAYGDTRLCSLSPPPPPRPAPRLVLSRAEEGRVRAALGPLCGDGDGDGDGDGLRFAAGAGYKMLCVILGLADAYVLSEGSTFAWDACAPHAILRALGGGVVALAGALRARRAGDTGPPPELVYNRPAEGAVGAERWANRGGLVAYAHPQHLEAVLAALATVPGL